MSLTVTPVALVPFAALVTVIVQVTVSFMWYTSLSAVFVMDTSTIGSTWIVLFTVLLMFSPITVNGLSGSPTTSSSTFIVIVAVLFAVMFEA